MTITVDLSPETESKVKTQASNDGLRVEEYVKTLIEDATNRRERDERIAQTPLDEILAPIRKNFADSGMTEDELDALIESERQAAWEEKHGKRG